MLPPFDLYNCKKMMHIIKINSIVFLSFFIIQCSNKNEPVMKEFDENYFVSGMLDPCDCNTKSVDLMNRTIKTRKSFSNVQELKSNQKAKKHITKIAKVYVKLAEKCFEKNATKLFIPSDCNNVKYLEEKQEELFSLGIRLNQGAKVWK